MKVITIVGARPQFIKAAVVSRAFSKNNTGAEEIIIHTGQHYDKNMSDIFFNELDIPKPHYNLGIGGGSHGQNTGRMIEAIEDILIAEKPNWVLVYGDTDSTLAGALASAKLNIPVAHVEAGLRSFNRKMPEELNRILTDHISELLFTPTDTATQNLKKEGISNPTIIQVGDVMLDATKHYKSKSKAPLLAPNIQKFILCTIHRAENTDNPKKLSNILSAINEIAKNDPVILPLHPRTRELIKLKKYNIANITIIDPVSYLEMIYLLDKCKLVITDSGGLQKEAFFFNKYCITTREETEWVELVNNNVNTLAGSNKDKIMSIYSSISKTDLTYSRINLFGEGDAGTKIVQAILGNRP